MNSKNKNQPASHIQLTTGLNKLDKKLSGEIQVLGHLLSKHSKQIKALDTKIDQREMSLREEIRITAQETKDEIRGEIREGNRKILTVIDDFIKEVRESRDERIIVSHKISNHQKRIEKLETAVFA